MELPSQENLHTAQATLHVDQAWSDASACSSSPNHHRTHLATSLDSTDRDRPTTFTRFPSNLTQTMMTLVSLTFLCSPHTRQVLTQAATTATAMTPPSAFHTQVLVKLVPQGRDFLSVVRMAPSCHQNQRSFRATQSVTALIIAIWSDASQCKRSRTNCRFKGQEGNLATSAYDQRLHVRS